MPERQDSKDVQEQPQERKRIPLPVGYRQGIITSITVLMGFSLLFLRYWSFELPGAWRASSIIADLLIASSILLQMVALWRSLQIKDDDEAEYNKTLRWFLASALVLLFSLALSSLSFAGALKF